MDNFTNDLKLNQLRFELNKNKEKILKDVKELSKIKDDNVFLSEVYNDYKDYTYYIKSIKKEQELQILRLLHYLEKNLLEKNLTEKMTREAMHEQKILLNKLQNVRNELKKITKDVEK